MKKHTVKISESVISDFPEISVSAVKVRIFNQSVLNSEIENRSAEIFKTREDILGYDQISSISEISKWRESYSKLGVKPSKYYSSIEALLRRVKNNGDFSTGIPVVDLYNLASIISYAPIGAYDLGKMPEGQIMLRHAQPKIDTFNPLGGQEKDFPLNDRLIVYALGTKILCWGFNTRDSIDFAVSNESTEIAFFSEATDRDSIKNARRALQNLQQAFSNVGADVGDIFCFNAAMSGGQI